MESGFIGKSIIQISQQKTKKVVANRFFCLYNFICTWAFVNTAFFFLSVLLSKASLCMKGLRLVAIISYIGIYSFQQLFGNNFPISNTQSFTRIRQRKFTQFSVSIVKTCSGILWWFVWEENKHPSCWWALIRLHLCSVQRSSEVITHTSAICSANTLSFHLRKWYVAQWCKQRFEIIFIHSKPNTIVISSLKCRETRKTFFLNEI